MRKNWSIFSWIQSYIIHLLVWVLLIKRSCGLWENNLASLVDSLVEPIIDGGCLRSSDLTKLYMCTYSTSCTCSFTNFLYGASKVGTLCDQSKCKKVKNDKFYFCTSISYINLKERNSHEPIEKLKTKSLDSILIFTLVLKHLLFLLIVFPKLVSKFKLPLRDVFQSSLGDIFRRQWLGRTVYSPGRL